MIAFLLADVLDAGKFAGQVEAHDLASAAKDGRAADTSSGMYQV